MLPGEYPLAEWIMACPGNIANRLFGCLAMHDGHAFARDYRQVFRHIQLRWCRAHRGPLHCPRCSATALVRKGRSAFKCKS